jgi:hypothetical protein
MHVRNSIQAGTLRDRRRGGHSRARNLSPQRRSEIASWARRNRKQRENGETPDAQYLKSLVNQIRAYDPDFAAFMKKVCSMPLRLQERISRILTTNELELINRARQAMEGTVRIAIPLGIEDVNEPFGVIVWRKP